MAFTTTTLSSAVVVTDTNIVVASATGFAANDLVLIDQEMMRVTQAYVSGTTIPVIRGVSGSATAAHAKGTNVTVGLASDFASPIAMQSVTYPTNRARTVTSYNAAGAITLPTPGTDALAIINGTTALAMTIAAPTKDMDGCMLWIAGNGAANHTWTFTGGLSGAGTSYDVFTVNSTAPVVTCAMAINGLWNSVVAVPMAGTVTNITGTIA